MSKNNPPIHPYPQDPTFEELADQLLGCGAVLSQIVSNMAESQKPGHSPGDEVAIPHVARSLVAEALQDIKGGHSRRDLKVAAAIVKEARDAICENIFVVDADWLAEMKAQSNGDGVSDPDLF